MNNEITNKIPKRKASDVIIKYSWIAFAAAAFYHLLAIIFGLNNSTGWHNCLFVVINLWCAIEVRRARKYFVILFTILYIQQLISHGASILRSMNENKMDWLSILVLCALTVMYVAVVVSASAKHRERSIRQ